MTLQPQAYFTFVRQLSNPFITDTLYVQAVIRDAYTDAIIATVNLSDKGGQRFKYDWKVPADPSGQGFYVSIVTSVYSDGGYTTKSENYGDEENTYLVQDRVLLRGRGGGGGIGIADLRRVVQEELDKRKPDYSSITGAFGALQREVNRIPKDDRTEEILKAIKDAEVEVPEQEPVNFAPVLDGMQKILTAVEQKDVTPETDITPVMEALQQLDVSRETDKQEIMQTIDTVKADLETVIKDEAEGVKQTEFSVAPMKAKAEKQPAVEKPVPLDLKQLAL